MKPNIDAAAFALVKNELLAPIAERFGTDHADRAFNHICWCASEAMTIANEGIASGDEVANAFQRAVKRVDASPRCEASAIMWSLFVPMYLFVVWEHGEALMPWWLHDGDYKDHAESLLPELIRWGRQEINYESLSIVFQRKSNS